MVHIYLKNTDYAPWGLMEPFETPHGMRERPKVWLTEIVRESDISFEKLDDKDIQILKDARSRDIIEVSGLDIVESVEVEEELIVDPIDVMEKTKQDIEVQKQFEKEDIYYPFAQNLVDKSVKDFRAEFKEMMKTHPPLHFLKSVRELEEEGKERITVLKILDAAIEKMTYAITDPGEINPNTKMSEIDNAYYDLIDIDLESDEE